MKLRRFLVLIITATAFAASGCGEVGVTITDATPTVSDRICSAQLGPMSLEELQTPSSEVEVLHFKALKVSGATPCAPQISRLNYRLLSRRVTGNTTFWPQIKMTINGQDATLTPGEPGELNGQWQLQTFSWVGAIHPTTNVGGESVKLVCTNCADSLPSGMSLISSLTQWDWVNNPGEEQRFETRIDIQQLTTFPF